MKWISPQIRGNQKHVNGIEIKQSHLSESEYLVLNDSSFWDITFDRLTAENIQLISNNALGKSAKTIKSTLCYQIVVNIFYLLQLFNY